MMGHTNAPTGRFGVLCAWPPARAILKTGKAFARTALPPQADRARQGAQRPCDRAPLAHQQYCPCPQHIALRRGGCTEPILKLRTILLGKTDFRCFAYHPYFESRITQ